MSEHMKPTPSDKLVVLYQQMYAMTEPECAHDCRSPRSCCDAMSCQIAEQTAKDWGVDVTSLRTGNETIPYMGPTGCVLEPHLRPMCTLHTCKINGLGLKPGDPEWTERYFKLREEIEDLESNRC